MRQGENVLVSKVTNTQKPTKIGRFAGVITARACQINTTCVPTLA
jgi:hypothetical protein